MAEVNAANTLTTEESEQRRAKGQSFLRRVWYNRPVSDEDAFVREFRSHSFGFVLVATWTLAIVRTLIIAYQQLFGSGPPEPLLQVIMSGALLYWLLPLIFWLFKDWARNYYHWVLDCFYTVYFVKVGLRGGPRSSTTPTS